MKIGPLHITWMTSRRARLVAIEVRDELRTNDVRNSIARLARGEVKNYLAELAEGAEMPFPSAAGFLRGIRDIMRTTATTNLTTDEDDTEPADDSPFNLLHEWEVIEQSPEILTLPNGHAATCTCPNKFDGLTAEIYCCSDWVPYPTDGNTTQCPTCKTVFGLRSTDEQPDPYSPGDEGVRAHRWADEKPTS